MSRPGRTVQLLGTTVLLLTIQACRSATDSGTLSNGITIAVSGPDSSLSGMRVTAALRDVTVIYESDLAFIHHTGFGELARSAAPTGTFVVGDTATADLPPSGAATCIGEGLTYLPEVVRQLASAGFSVEITRQYGSLPLPPRRVAVVARRR